MDPSMRKIAEALFEAIRAEADGQRFYRMAARCSVDLKAQEVFEQLAREEQGHLEFLRAQYRAVLEGGGLDSSIKLTRPRDLSEASPIFSTEIKDRIGQAHYEMTALSIGLQLEQSAVRHYRSAAEECGAAEASSFFMELAAWEQGHYDGLLRQQEALRDDYWGANGFAPF